MSVAGRTASCATFRCPRTWAAAGRCHCRWGSRCFCSEAQPPPTRPRSASPGANTAACRMSARRTCSKASRSSVDKAGEKRPDLKDAVVLVGLHRFRHQRRQQAPGQPAMPRRSLGRGHRRAAARGRDQGAADVVQVPAGGAAGDADHPRLGAASRTDGGPIFVAINIALLAAAFVGLDLLRRVPDIFASIGFFSQLSASPARTGGSAGARSANNDYRDEYRSAQASLLVMARLRFIANPGAGRVRPPCAAARVPPPRCAAGSTPAARR